MIKFRLQIQIAVFFALVVGISFFYLNITTQRLLQSHSIILHQLTDLDIHNEQINKEVLNSAYRLYDTYDKVNSLLSTVSTKTESLNSTPLLNDPAYRKIKEKLKQFVEFVQEREKLIQKFITLNALIKNSATYVPTLSRRYLEQFEEHDKAYLLQLLKITSAVFLAHNAMDAELLENIKKSILELESQPFDSSEKRSFNRLFLSHAKVMSRYLSVYQPIFENILNNAGSQLLHETEETFIAISTREAEKLSSLSYLVMVAFLASIIFIIYLLFNVEISRIKQIQLHDELEKRATTDSLTGLDNRFSFRQIEQSSSSKGHLILINIDGFKHINDFYGREIGDLVLKHVADNVMLFATRQSIKKGFRLGADEFGLLIDNVNNEIPSLAKTLIGTIESDGFSYQDIQLQLRVSAGISNVSPLLETADMALRKIKDTRSKYFFYSKDQQLEKYAKDNLLMMQVIQEAIDNDKIIPYFMPLMRNSDEQIVAFECLMRLQDNTDSFILPGEFLPIAKNGRLYGKLTRIMIEKCFEKFKGNDYFFSINLSVQDIEDEQVSEFIIDKLEQYPQMGKRLILEILESEGISNYLRLQQFFDKVKQLGCRIAIDDYGSGYSNLRHLLNLQVDSLKIDGSLVKPLQTADNSKVVVKTIVDMARDLDIASTTAEYVSNQEIFNVVRRLNITYSQGYFIGQALPELVRQPDYQNKENSEKV